MKKILIKALSLVICSVLLIGAMYTLPTFAATEGNATLTPTGMTYQHTTSQITGSHYGFFRTLWLNYSAIYAITLESDKAFDGSVYDSVKEGRNTVTHPSSSTIYKEFEYLDYAYKYNVDTLASHDELADMLRNNIYINGKSLATAVEENAYTTTSVLVGILENKITILIPVKTHDQKQGVFVTNTEKAFNTKEKGFYVGAFSDSDPAAVDYTISIGDGIKIGDVAINPMSYKFTATNKSNANTGDFTDEDNLGGSASILSVNTVVNTNSKYTSGNKSGYTVVTIGTDRKLYETNAVANDNGKYYTARLNQKNTAYTFEKTSSYKDFQEKILINGVPLSTYMLNCANANVNAGASITPDWDTYLGVGAGYGASTSHNLYLSLPVVEFSVSTSKGTRYFGAEQYGYDLTNGFTVTILPGLVLNGYSLQSGVITVDSSNASNFSETNIDVMGASVDTAANGDIRFEINADFANYAYGIEEVGVIMIPTAFVTNGDNVVSLDAKYYKDMKPAIKKLSATDVAGTTQIFAVLKNSSAKDIRIRTDISARAYIKFNDGTIVYSQNNDNSIDITNGTSSRSCIDVVRAIVKQNSITGVDTILAKADKEWTVNEYNTVISTINQQLYDS